MLLEADQIFWYLPLHLGSVGFRGSLAFFSEVRSLQLHFLLKSFRPYHVIEFSSLCLPHLLPLLFLFPHLLSSPFFLSLVIQSLPVYFIALQSRTNSCPKKESIKSTFEDNLTTFACLKGTLYQWDLNCNLLVTNCLILLVERNTAVSRYLNATLKIGLWALEKHNE